MEEDNTLMSEKNIPSPSAAEPSELPYWRDPKLTTVRQEEDEILSNMLERAKYIPIRLGKLERKRLRLLEATLQVNDYTAQVDSFATLGKQGKRAHVQMKELCSILTGLILSFDLDEGKKLIEEKNFDKFQDLYQEVFEVGRRHKIMNPEKMRGEYGKMIYFLQDVSLLEETNVIQNKLVCKREIKTVYSVLSKGGSLKMLLDPLIYTATKEIYEKGKTRKEVQREIKDKERAQEILSEKFKNENLSEEDLLLCLRSIGDNNNFLRNTYTPINKMIQLLLENFRPDVIDEGYSLAIQEGSDGARLSHHHELQFNYVLQSLILWREINKDMFRFWYLAEEDLLDSSNKYELTDTGQGLNRVQPSPRVSVAIHNLLNATKKKVMDWVGSSVIHLGDKNVPNALMFIDKYTQVQRIINPIIITIDQIEHMKKDKGIKRYIKVSFGGRKKLIKSLLLDFFRYAFDGSGADNFFDAGSCIDGRLTSAWNWCQKLPEKPFYPIFKLAGFIGFDGDFQK